MVSRVGRWVAVWCCMCSCSLVLEDRDNCPCELEVSVEGVNGETEVVVDGSVCARVWGDSTVVCRVPRGELAVMAVSGVSAEEFSGYREAGGFRIPEGLDSPPLYLGYAVVDAKGESARTRLRVSKEYCALTLELEGPPGWAEPYSIDITSDVCGTASNGCPLQGSFSHRLTLSEDGRARVLLPRQLPGGRLEMEILMQDRLLRTFSLASCMQKAGYDWSAPDLEDIQLELRFSVTAFTVHVGLWSQTFPLDVEI